MWFNNPLIHNLQPYTRCNQCRLIVNRTKGSVLTFGNQKIMKTINTYLVRKNSSFGKYNEFLRSCSFQSTVVTENKYIFFFSPNLNVGSVTATNVSQIVYSHCKLLFLRGHNRSRFSTISQTRYHLLK